jgi:hypothetical protein
MLKYHIGSQLWKIEKLGLILNRASESIRENIKIIRSKETSQIVVATRYKRSEWGQDVKPADISKKKSGNILKTK